MQTIFLIDFVLVSIITLTNINIGLLVYLNNKKSLVNKTFFFITLTTNLWILSAFLSEILKDTEIKIFLSKLAFSAVFAFLMLLYYFSSIFPSRRQIKKIFTIPLYLIGIILIILTLFTNLMIRDIMFRPWGFDIIYGSLYIFFSIYSILCIILILSNLFIGYKVLNTQEKLRVKYLILGLLFFGLISGFINIILPILIGSDIYYRLGNYSIIFFIAFTAYAIVKHQLFEIRVVLTTVFTFIIGIILFAQIFISRDIPSIILRVVLFLAYAYFGYLLVKSVLKEIEQRKHIEELARRLEKANKRLKELDKLKDEFISVASHDLRAPIAVIEGYLSMILSGKVGKVNKNTRKFLEKMYASTQYLAKLSRDILETSRINQKRLKLDLELNDIKEVVKSMTDHFQIMAQEKGIYLKCRLPKKKIPKFLFDRQRVEEVLQNLISNAIKFTNKGGIEVGVELRPAQKIQAKFKKKTNKEVLVWVKDTGIGIPKDKLRYIFEKFSQLWTNLHPSKRGSGLGLFICRKIIEFHGGKIWANSEGEGKGSIFFFTLPVIKK